MNTCDHGHAVVVYTGQSTCPLCAAKEEIAEHEKTNSALVEDVNAKIETINELQEEIVRLNTNIKIFNRT